MDLTQIKQYICLKNIPLRKLITKDMYNQAMSMLPPEEFKAHYFEMFKNGPYMMYVDELTNDKDIELMLLAKISEDNIIASDNL